MPRPDRLFLTGGARGEFNDGLAGGTQFAALPTPRASWLGQGGVTVKIRAARRSGEYADSTRYLLGLELRRYWRVYDGRPQLRVTLAAALSAGPRAAF